MALKQFYRFLKNHLTKLLGLAQGVVAAVAGVSGVIPTHHLPKWMAVLAVLTFLRGYVSPIQPQKDKP